MLQKSLLAGVLSADILRVKVPNTEVHGSLEGEILDILRAV